MNDEKIRTYAKLLPKLELHAHLNGCIREPTLLDLMAQHHIKVTPELSSLLSAEFHMSQIESSSLIGSSGITNDSPETKNKRRSLSECFLIFPLIHKSVCTLNDLERITFEALEDFSRENVCYLEIRSTPRRLQKLNENENEHKKERDMKSLAEVASKKDYVDAVLRIFRVYQENEWERYNKEINVYNQSLDRTSNNNNKRTLLLPRLPLIPRLLISIDRSGTVPEAIENVELAIQFYQEGNEFVVGVDLGGNPTKNKFRDFEPALALAKKAGLKISVHCGEVPFENDSYHVEEVQDILQFRPDRLGHALFLPDNAYNKLHANPIPIECCPTSNTMTLELVGSHEENSDNENLIHGLKRHPKLSTWIEQNYPLSISTDDPGIFHTNSSLEYYRLKKAYGLSISFVGNIVKESVNHIFERKVLGDLNVIKFLKTNVTNRVNDLIALMSVEG